MRRLCAFGSIVRPLARGFTAAVLPTALTVLVATSASATQFVPVDTRFQQVRLSDLASVQRSLRAVARREARDVPRVAEWADVAVLLDAVLGVEAPAPLSGLVLSGSDGPGPVLGAAPGVANRDEVAYQMLIVGYSVKETADVVSGRITRLALDTARRMIAVGLGRDAAADFLDAEYARVQSVARMPDANSDQLRDQGPFDEVIERQAQAHAVDVALIRAIIAAESGFDPTARSVAGAIGLMQLMPATARELGVDPFVPAENIAGGVRYFAQLLSEFGDLELALVAYNAGPGFAKRYLRGEAALYGETRAYVRRVLATRNRVA